MGALLHMHYLCKNLDADAEEEHVPSVGKGRIFTLIKALPDILVHKAPCVAIDYNGLNFPYYQEGGAYILQICMLPTRCMSSLRCGNLW